MKKTLAFLLALTLLFALSVTALADDPDPLNAVVPDPTDPASISDHTFVAYQIFTGTQSVDATEIGDISKLASIGWGSGIDEAAFLTALKKDTTIGSKFGDTVKTAADVAEVLSAYQNDSVFARTFAKIADGCTKGNGTPATEETVFEPGYYLVKDTTSGKDFVNLSLLQLTQKGAFEIRSKVEVPSVKKEIDAENDTDETNDEDENGKVDDNNAAIGDKVPYIVSSKVPDMSAYEKYFFIVNDTMSKGLTFNNDVVITLDGVELDEDTDYTVSSSTDTDTGVTSIQIVFINFIKYKADKGAPIVITYSGTVNEKAVIGVDGNPNTATITYSNNPNVTPKGENIPDKDDVVGTTPASEVKTFVTEILLKKIDGTTKEALANASFELTGTKLNTTIVSTQVFTEDANGTYYKLMDKTYTDKAPTDLTKDQYASTETTYTMETKKEVVEKKEDVHYTGTTGEDGLLSFTGLAAGEYTLKETKAPNGYNILAESIPVTITWTAPATDSTKCTWGVKEDNATVDEDGIINITVENNSGTTLPETGGIGTTIFYVAGGILAVAAAIILFAKKKVED